MGCPGFLGYKNPSTHLCLTQYPKKTPMPGHLSLSSWGSSKGKPKSTFGRSLTPFLGLEREPEKKKKKHHFGAVVSFSFLGVLVSSKRLVTQLLKGLLRDFRSAHLARFVISPKKRKRKKENKCSCRAVGPEIHLVRPHTKLGQLVRDDPLLQSSMASPGPCPALF